MDFSADQVEDVTIIEPKGDTLDASNAAEFKADMEKLLQNSSRKLLLDMQNLKFVDSSGLGAIISLLRRLKSAGGDMKLCQMSATVRALFELVRLHRIFNIVPSRDEGLARFRSQDNL